MPDHYKFWLDSMLGKIPVILILATSARAGNGQAMLSLVPFLIIAKRVIWLTSYPQYTNKNTLWLQFVIPQMAKVRAMAKLVSFAFPTEENELHLVQI